MRRGLFRCAAALTLLIALATAAQAQVNLAWSDCGSNGTQNRDFACGTNNSSPTNPANYHVLVGSFIAPAGVTAMTGEEMVVDFISATSPLPDWWNMGGGTNCRAAGDLAIVAFGDPGGGLCANYFGSNGAQGGFALFVGGGGSNVGADRGRIVFQAAVIPEVAGPVTPGEEQYSFGLQIKNTKTVGVGSCGGCTTPVCLVLNSIRLTQPVGVGDFDLTGPAGGPGSDTVTWQGGTGANCANVPARAQTWGRVKALYR